MNEMRPHPALPPAPDHEQHDPLLVAQHAAGDRLETRQQQEAERLVATCGACAALADDLRALAAAVAHEPLPPRRRDFRLSHEDAERLEAGPVTRLLRRFSLPRSRVFAPAAAGMLTVGLAFVVAGYAWPDDGVVDMTREAPLTQTVAPSPLGADAQAIPFSLEAGVPEADAHEGRALEAAAPEASAALAAAPEVDTLAAGASDRNAPGDATTEEAAAFMVEEVVGEDVAGQDVVGEDRTVESAEKSLLEELAPEGDAGVADETEQDLGVVADDVTAPVESRMSTAADAVPGEGLDTAASTDVGAAAAGAPAAEDGDLSLLLTGLGFVLAVAGGLALLLAWLARRTIDPLLR